KSGFDLGLFAHVGRLEQVLADLRAWCRRHLFGTDHKDDARLSRRDRLETLMHGCGTRRARVLDPCCPFETKIWRGLQHQGGGKILRGEAGVEMTEEDFIDISRSYASIGERLTRDLDDQAFDGLGIEPPKWRMRPSDDATGHRYLPDASLPNFGRFSH